MSKIIPYISPSWDSPHIYVAHWNAPGPRGELAWHQVWWGPYDDIYWRMGASGGWGYYVPETDLYSMCLFLAGNPEIVRRNCSACWYREEPFLFGYPKTMQINTNLYARKPCIPTIYWPHVYEYDNNPPGFYYPWQLP